MSRSLQTRLTALLCALAIVPVLAVGGLLIAQIFLREREHARVLEQQIVSQAASEIARHLADAETELYSLIQAPAVRGTNRAQQETALRQALVFRDTFDELAILDVDGQERVRVSRLGVAPAAELMSRAGEPVLVEPLRTTKAYFGNFSVSPLSGEPLLLMAVPTLNVNTGAVDGVVVANVRMRQVFEWVTSIPVGNSGAILVATEDGKIIAHPNLSQLPASARLPVEEDSGVAVSITGQEVLRVRQPLGVGNLSMIVAAELPLQEADAPMRQALLLTLPLLLGAVLITALMSFGAAGQIVRPITALATATRRISQGDMSQSVVVTRADELGALQQDFNRMVSDLQAQRAAVEERTAQLQHSLDRQRDLLDTVARLSTPLLPVWEGVVVMPVIGHVDEARGTAITTALIRGVSERHARVAILDITGIASFDQALLHTLLRAASAVRLLGARPMLAGVSASIAVQITSSDIPLGHLPSFRDLRSAVEAALNAIEESAAIRA